MSQLGGDEFAILTRADSLESVPEIERRLDGHFAESDANARKPYRLGCSLGGTLIDGDSAERLDQMLARADQLLYAAKRRRKAALLALAAAGTTPSGQA